MCAVKLVPAVRSLTVCFDASYQFEDIVRTLPTVAEVLFDPGSDQLGLDWSKVLVAGLLALLPLGTFGNVALSVVQSVAEQMKEGRRLRLAAGPTGRVTRPRRPR